MQIRFGNQSIDLNEVFVQDFGDNYHKFNDEPSTDLERTVKKIRRRYRDISDYKKAVVAYNEYMQLLALRHGGPELLRLKIKYNKIDDFIPPIPGIKVNELNKFVMKNKIILSKRHSAEIDEEKLARAAQSYKNINDDKFANDIIPENPDDKLLLEELDPNDQDVKMVRKLIKGGVINASQGVGKGKLRKDIESIEYLEEYFYTKNTSDAKIEESTPVFSLSDYYDGSFARKLVDTTNEERGGTVFFRGNYIDPESADELSLYRTLGESGWNSMRIMRDFGVSKKIKNAMKKGDKKQSKKNKKKKKNDDLVVQIMTDGGYDSFEDFKSEMESFSAEDIFSD